MKYIAYYRVSTNKQGLGLEAQRSIIAAYVANNGGEIAAEYSEKESGKDTLHRPCLQAAIAQCQATGDTLIVAKLDRLSRDVADIFALKKTKGLAFAVCDMDATDTMMLGIMATLAQKERELISRRTRDALAALKAQGVKLGAPNAAEHMRNIYCLGNAARRANATNAPANRTAWNVIRLMQGTMRDKAAYLNAEGYRTRNGKMWTPAGVQRLIARYEAV